MTAHASNLSRPASFWDELPRPIIGLAPMDGVTDAAFRVMVARECPPDVTFTEFTSAGDVCRGPDHLLTSLLYSDVERPIVAQLYGKDPALFYQAAQMVCALGYDGVDINMGCPSRNVASSGSGAGLIRTPGLAQAIIQAVRQGVDDWAAGRSLREAGVSPKREALLRAMNLNRCGREEVSRWPIPLSVKTRIGFDADMIDTWFPCLLQEHPAAISLHGRTLQQMYRGEADWTAIGRAAALARGSGTLVLGNGDLVSLGDVVRRLLETGVDGVLVGRGALGEPWFFKAKEAARSAVVAGESYVPVTAASLAQRFSAMLEHARQFERCFGVQRFPHIRKHLAWYCKGFPHAAAMRGRLVRASSSADVLRLVTEYDAGTLNGSDSAVEPPEPLLECGLSAIRP